MARVYTKIGDIFSAKVSDNSKKYLQYIANDLTQLNSDIIRAFKKEYPIGETPELSEVIKGEIDFYAHCVVKWGVKLGFWEKVGNSPYNEIPNVIFRSTNDDGDTVKISHQWWVWKIGEEHRYIGKLSGENQKAEIGSVIQPKSIVHRMRTGRYISVFPGF